mmetsp:Transcript_6084/g.9330  ORF Transcript_6084/g.9330 Transcript_6084/m.9330 type:complete len:186 (+) Transcript_6084:138-695(+)|eukprot:CAMPEP_0178926594 /NCGR_PEP_ID=MMETSP0786-20121207/18637_1 /TAXON_ID=186022 /ORGANISM="Thalassionema frauenfeldii, Strain CCMP 1798" /LENGTH=185 /DNA_ID=CAMNT_0020601769 /DNA_START=103 /DNA_END=660 /DNA_ORIENTATION=+
MTATTTCFTDLLQQQWFAPHLMNFFENAGEATRFACVSRDCRVVSLQPQTLFQTQCHWHGPTHQYYAKPWQDIAISAVSNAHSVVLKCFWRDQGWGNRKGMISVVTDNGAAPNDYAAWSKDVVCGKEPAPHDLEPLLLQFRPSPEGTYKIWLRVGGGGGHQLVIEDLTVRILSYQLTSTDDEVDK